MNTNQKNKTNNPKNSFGATRAVNFAHLVDWALDEIKHQVHRCNICRRPFIPEFRYQLFCGKCRSQDDSFISNDYFSHPPESVSMALGN